WMTRVSTSLLERGSQRLQRSRLGQIQLQRGHGYRAVLGRAQIALPLCLALLPTETDPVIGYAARIDTMVEYEICEIALSLFDYLDTSDGIRDHVREIDVDQHAFRPAGLQQFADHLRRMVLGGGPFHRMAELETLAQGNRGHPQQGPLHGHGNRA